MSKIGNLAVGLFVLAMPWAAPAEAAPAEAAPAEAAATRPMIFCCAADNDLFRCAVDNKLDVKRVETPQAAVEAAGPGSGVLLLADGYPGKTTVLPAGLLEQAAAKRLRVYVEFPAALPGLTAGFGRELSRNGPPRRTSLERVVVTSDAFGAALKKMQILAIHDCHYVPVAASNPLLAVAKVAGFDRAVYGLEGVQAQPILFEHGSGGLLVSTTKLSQFITARYAPKEAMQAVWAYVLGWLEGDKGPGRKLEWTATVRPSFGRDEPLPADAARRAVQRGVDWHTRSGMILDEEGWKAYNDLRKTRKIDPGNPIGSLPRTRPGDGRFGVLEGISSQIGYDGSQSVRWWLRSDSNGESSLAFALRWKMDGDERSRAIATNLLDWLYLRSGLFQNDPAKANFGLLFWAPDNAQALYQDNDVKAILGCLGTAGAFKTDRWDEVLVKNILATSAPRACTASAAGGWRTPTCCARAGRATGAGPPCSSSRTTRPGRGRATCGCTTRPTGPPCWRRPATPSAG